MHGMSRGCQSPLINRGDHLFTAKVKVDCWSSLYWSLIPPRINRGDHLFMRKWELTVDPLCINHQSTPRIKSVDCPCIDHQSSIASILSIDHLYVDLPPQDQQCWLPPHWLLIASMLGINHWSAPPRINSVDRLCIDCWSSITSASTVDRPPYRFRLSNL